MERKKEMNKELQKTDKDEGNYTVLIEQKPTMA